MLVPRPGRSERAPSQPAASQSCHIRVSVTGTQASSSGRRKRRPARALAGHLKPRRYLPADQRFGQILSVEAERRPEFVRDVAPALPRAPEHAVPAHPRRHERRPPGHTAPTTCGPIPAVTHFRSALARAAHGQQTSETGFPQPCEIEPRPRKPHQQSDFAYIVANRRDAQAACYARGRGFESRRSRRKHPVNQAPSVVSLDADEAGLPPIPDADPAREIRSAGQMRKQACSGAGLGARRRPVFGHPAQIPLAHDRRADGRGTRLRALRLRPRPAARVGVAIATTFAVVSERAFAPAVRRRRRRTRLADCLGLTAAPRVVDQNAPAAVRSASEDVGAVPAHLDRAPVGLRALELPAVLDECHAPGGKDLGDLTAQ
jgi:hypothetical protein